MIVLPQHCPPHATDRLGRQDDAAQRAYAIVIACVAVSLAGCGGGDSGSGPPPAITTQILSDSGFDGDIQQTSPSTFAATQGMSPTVQSVFAGIDPATLTEFRRSSTDYSRTDRIDETTGVNRALRAPELTVTYF
jgi:hypothetical protein